MELLTEWYSIAGFLVGMIVVLMLLGFPVAFAFSDDQHNRRNHFHSERHGFRRTNRPHFIGENVFLDLRPTSTTKLFRP